MKYKCIALDHDDTVVDSTRNIHYPSFIEYLKKVRPNEEISFEEYIEKNSDPGLLSLCVDKYKFSKEELDNEFSYWKSYVKNHIPTAYKGFDTLLKKFKDNGGIVCVISHSLSENITRDYIANGLPLPDDIFGWELPEEERKPSPYPLKMIMKKYHLEPKDILVVDDLKPGYDMAKSVGVSFAAAAWAYEVSEVKEFMTKNSDYYLTDINSLEKILF